ncbi:hypothetical protein CTS44_22469 [Comamonas thiooxydans]|nr:hypothetical protein CTS44_22469 [Comamonas thiooxydans]
MKSSECDRLEPEFKALAVCDDMSLQSKPHASKEVPMK